MSLPPHHAFLLTEHLSQLDYLDDAVTRVSAQIAQRLANDQAALELLDTIPGMGQRAAEIMLAEIGTEMARFPSAKHLASWAGMCPGNKESGGKRLSGKTRKGHIWLQHVLFEVAHAASKTRIPTCRHSIGGWLRGGANNARSSPSGTVSW